VQELVGIVDYTRHNPAAVEPLKVSMASSNYWSSTTYAYDPTFAWGVNFYNGYVLNDLKTDDGYVRAVRDKRTP